MPPSKVDPEEINRRIAATVAFTAALKDPTNPPPSNPATPSLPRAHVASSMPVQNTTTPLQAPAKNCARGTDAMAQQRPTSQAVGKDKGKGKDTMVQRIRSRITSWKLNPRRSKTHASLAAIFSQPERAQSSNKTSSRGSMMADLMIARTPSHHSGEIRITDDPFVTPNDVASTDPFADEHLFDTSVEAPLSSPPLGSSTPRRKKSVADGDYPSQEKDRTSDRSRELKVELGNGKSDKAPTSPSPGAVKEGKPGRAKSLQAHSCTSTGDSSLVPSRIPRRSSSAKVVGSPSPIGAAPLQGKRLPFSDRSNVEVPNTGSNGGHKRRSRCSSKGSHRSATMQDFAQLSVLSEESPRRSATPLSPLADKGNRRRLSFQPKSPVFGSRPHSMQVPRSTSNCSEENSVSACSGEQQLLALVKKHPSPTKTDLNFLSNNWPSFEGGATASSSSFAPPPAPDLTPRRQTLAAIPRYILEEEEDVRVKKHPSPTKQDWDVLQMQWQNIQNTGFCN